MSCGISIYKDKKETLLVIPFASDENGIGRDTEKYILIQKPYDNMVVGEKVINCFLDILKNPYQDSKLSVKAHELATGIKSYKAFSKDRLMISGGYDEKRGYTFTPWKRYDDGTYGLDKDDKVIDFSTNSQANPEEIGDLVMQAFNATLLLY